MFTFDHFLSTTLWEQPLTVHRRRLFVVLALVPALLLLWEAGRSAAAMTLAASANPDALEWAVRLDPSNPALEEELGLDYLDGLGAADSLAALNHFRSAVVLGPERASSWAKMAVACDSLNDSHCAERGLVRALRLAPMTPHLYWLAGNYYLRRSQPERALPLLRRLLELDSSYAQPTFSVCLRMLKDPELIEHALMPAGKDPNLRLAYANFLDAQGESGAARRAWADAVRLGSRFPFSLVEPYVDRLIDSGRLEQAVSAWSDLERLGVIGAGDAGNLVYNGGFERPLLHAGFDWRYQQEPYVAADFKDAGAFEGQHCLRLDYMGTNADFEPVLQWVPVASRQRYLLTAEMRSERISSNSGPRLRVVDPGCPACLDVSSEMAVGSTAWRQVSIEVTAGPQTRWLRLSVWRPHSRAFPTEITGRFWLDAVRLRTEPATPSPNA